MQRNPGELSDKIHSSGNKGKTINNVARSKFHYNYFIQWLWFQEDFKKIKNEEEEEEIQSKKSPHTPHLPTTPKKNKNKNQFDNQETAGENKINQKLLHTSVRIERYQRKYCVAPAAE